MPSSFERGYRLAAARARGDEGPHLDEETEQLDAATPRGLLRIHSSWYELPPASERADTRDYLARLHLGHLVSMDTRDEGIARVLGALTFAELAELVRALGRRRLAIALVEAPRHLTAQVCARLGEPEASRLLEDIAAARGRATRAEVRALQRTYSLAIPATVDQLAVQGLTWLTAGLSDVDEDAARRVAQRLERSLGETLLALLQVRERPEDAERRSFFAALDELLPKLSHPV